MWIYGSVPPCLSAQEKFHKGDNIIFRYYSEIEHNSFTQQSV